MNEKEIIRGKKTSMVYMYISIAILVFIWTYYSIEVFWNMAITVLQGCCGVILIIRGIIESGSTIVVTDKRVSGKTKTGKQVDIPINMISSVASSALTQTVTVASSSGRISFCIANAVDVANEINKLMMYKQDNANYYSAPIVNQVSTPDELKKYKELLDAGAITQEEFDAKKKQLLGL